MRPLRAAGALALAGCVAALLAACAQDEGPETMDIVSNIPWTAPEEYHYALRQNGEEKGNAVLRIEAEGGDRLRLIQRFSDDEGNSDDSVAVVEAETLKPVSSVRTITDPDRKAVAEATYEPGLVRITENNFAPPDERTPDSTRSNPMRVPEHSYDNHASLFLWRTIPFEEGWTGSYNTIITNRRDKRVLTVRVIDKRRVETRAGEFDSWYVEIDAGGEPQRAWFSTEEDHRLLAYINGDILFLYEGEA
jgi:hypothetical protein